MFSAFKYFFRHTCALLAVVFFFLLFTPLGATPPGEERFTDEQLSAITLKALKIMNIQCDV